MRSETQQKPMAVGEFCWNELLTSDEAGATKFYSAVFGWQTAQFPGEGVKYTIWKNQGKGVGGLMKRPMENIPPHWLGYVTVANVDATAKKAGEAGGKVMMPAFDVPTVGRIAVIQDPQGASLGIIQPLRSIQLQRQPNRLVRHTGEGPRSGDPVLLGGARRADQEGATRGHELRHAAARGGAWSERMPHHGL